MQKRAQKKFSCYDSLQREAYRDEEKERKVILQYSKQYCISIEGYVEMVSSSDYVSYPTSGIICSFTGFNNVSAQDHTGACDAEGSCRKDCNGAWRSRAYDSPVHGSCPDGGQGKIHDVQFHAQYVPGCAF